MRSPWHVFILGLLVLARSLAPVQATPLLPGNVLISSSANLQSGTIREYTPAGVLVQTFAVPTPSGVTPYPRDIATDSLGRINVWNGTFTPVLTTMTPSLAPGSATSVNNTLAGWSTVNATYFGGLAVGGNYAYATDMATSNGGEPNGIVRFDLTSSQAIRFGQGAANTHGDYIDLNIGLDGLLYAIYPGGSPAGNMLDVFNPLTMALLRTVNLNMDLGAIAVDQAGEIFATSPFDPRIFRFNANGVLTGSLVTGTDGLRDLDLSGDGRLFTISGNGRAIFTDITLASMTSFNAGPANTFFGAFVTAVAAVPESGGTALLLISTLLPLGVAGLVMERRKA
jgi:hypothetical protein